jgi:hypothetical protein
MAKKSSGLVNWVNGKRVVGTATAGSTGDKHAPKLPAVKHRPASQNQIPAKRVAGKK